MDNPPHSYPRLPILGLVNGSRGVVVSLIEETVTAHESAVVLDSKTVTLQREKVYVFPVVRYDNGVTMKMRHQARKQPNQAITLPSLIRFRTHILTLTIVLTLTLILL